MTANVYADASFHLQQSSVAVFERPIWTFQVLTSSPAALFASLFLTSEHAGTCSPKVSDYWVGVTLLPFTPGFPFGVPGEALVPRGASRNLHLNPCSSFSRSASGSLQLSTILPTSTLLPGIRTFSRIQTCKVPGAEVDGLPSRRE